MREDAGNWLSPPASRNIFKGLWIFRPIAISPLTSSPTKTRSPVQIRRGRLFKYDEVACSNTTRSPVQIRRVRLQIVNSFPFVLGEVGRTSKGRTCYGRNLQSTLSVTSYLKSLTAMPVNQVYEPFMYYLSITKKNTLRTSVVSGFSREASELMLICYILGWFCRKQGVHNRSCV